MDGQVVCDLVEVCLRRRRTGGAKWALFVSAGRCVCSLVGRGRMTRRGLKAPVGRWVGVIHVPDSRNKGAVVNVVGEGALARGGVIWGAWRSG